MKIRAIIIDDDDQIREAVKLICLERGYEVHTFSQPLLCPIYLEHDCQCPQEYACGDILISDINMPRVSGLDFIENQVRGGCKGNVRNKALMSGTWNDDQLKRAENLNCKIFHKPVSYHELTAWFDECEQRINPNRKLTEIL